MRGRSLTRGKKGIRGGSLARSKDGILIPGAEGSESKAEDLRVRKTWEGKQEAH